MYVQSQKIGKSTNSKRLWEKTKGLKHNYQNRLRSPMHELRRILVLLLISLFRTINFNNRYIY
jgi:hypothetical protein